MAEQSDAAAAAAALPDSAPGSSSPLTDVLGEVVDRFQGTPSEMINDGAAPSAPDQAMPSASSGELPYASVQSDRAQHIPLQDAPYAPAESERGKPIPLQDADRPIGRGS